eukprot:scaffold255497_cov33-Prasinocladus_malaysianus.AAC.1
MMWEGLDAFGEPPLVILSLWSMVDDYEGMQNQQLIICPYRLDAGDHVGGRTCEEVVGMLEEPPLVSATWQAHASSTALQIGWGLAVAAMTLTL